MIIIFTFIFNDNKKIPLYEQLYLYIRYLIEKGTLKNDERLPSKRKLSAHLNISQSTIENAYTQLIAEGYVYAVEKKGYFVSQVEQIARSNIDIPQEIICPDNKKKSFLFDLKTNEVDTENFQFSVWAKLMRECLKNESETLLKPIHPQGDAGLRNEIAAYLSEYRGMKISPEQIILGAGSEYLLGLITELLPSSVYAIENPGYHKTAKILKSRGVKLYGAPMDREGMSIAELKKIPAEVAHITPSHHYPLGTVMSINRRMQILQWAAQNENRYIIEDDYDSEYRFVLKPVPSLQSLDANGKVIYMNTFAKTLAPTLRIGYMVLPKKLLTMYMEKLIFYSCTVSEFEQRTLKAFMQGGYYARHVNRMRNVYKNRRDVFLEALSPLENIVEISGQDAGTHLLLYVKNGMSEAQLIQSAAEKGVGVYALSDCYIENIEDTGTVIAGYAAFKEDELKTAADLLIAAWK